MKPRTVRERALLASIQLKLMPLEDEILWAAIEERETSDEEYLLDLEFGPEPEWVEISQEELDKMREDWEQSRLDDDV